MSDVKIKIKDRDGVVHEVDAPTDMNMNLMEIVRSYELAPEGTIGICGGMAMCAVFLIGLIVLPFAPETRGQPLPDEEKPFAH